MPEIWKKLTKIKDYKLIGRTTASSKFSEGKFTKQDYYRISKAVRLTILQNQLDSLPIDLHKIIHNNKWNLYSFSEARNMLNSIKVDLTKNNYGFTLRIGRRMFIFYDENVSIPLQRFTIAHEIGHIVLKHFYINDHNNDEKEANMFAARLLMPMCVLHECNIYNASQIQEICEVSEMAAYYRYKRLKLVEERGKFYTDKLELEVYKLFKKYIDQYNHK